ILNTANSGVTKEQCTPENLLYLRHNVLAIKANSPHNMPELTQKALDEIAATIDRKEAYTGQSYYELYNDIKNSLSFKTGRAITALPRLLKKLFKRNKQE
ncbi:MAG: hypothetical protein LUI60_08030, partial [Clostridia bacterium]|nr:hypothetical protein [Clostridia bacterium]